MVVNPAVLNAALLGVVALTNAIAAYITNSLAAKRSDKVANQLAHTTSTQDIKLNAIAVTADKTHKLVNSRMGDVLRALVVSAQSLYNVDSSQANLDLLVIARRNLDTHMKSQEEADKVGNQGE